MHTGSTQDGGRSVIHILAFDYDDFALDQLRFFDENAELLAEHGIFHPFRGAGDTPARWNSFLGALFTLWSHQRGNPSGDPAEARDILEAALSEWEKPLLSADGLLLAAPMDSIAIGLPMLLSTLQDARRFPRLAGARRRWVWRAADQALALDGLCRWFQPWDPTQIPGIQLEWRRAWFEALSIFLQGDPAEAPVILAHADGKHPDAATLIRALDLPVPPERLRPLRDTRIHSRELFHIHQTLAHALGMGHATAYALLQPMEDAAPLSDTFVAPKDMEAIRAAWAPGMEDVFRSRLGRPWTPPPLPERRDWRPFTPPEPQRIQEFLERALAALPAEGRALRLRMLARAWDGPLPRAEAPIRVNAIASRLEVAAPRTPRLTVLTLTKNHERHIGACIEGVLKQRTSFPVEHVIVDDGSSDGARAVIMEHAGRHGNITPIFLHGAAGPGRNVLALLNACQSEYAAFCEGDDYFTDPDKLQKQADLLDAHPECAICFHQAEVAYEDGTPSRFQPTDAFLDDGRGGRRAIFTLEDLLRGNFMQTCTVMYRWRFREGVPEWFDPTLVQEDWYLHLLHAEIGPAICAPGAMSVYRRHAGALFAAAERDHLEQRRIHGLEELRSYAVFNRHFGNRRHANFRLLAGGVFADFVAIYAATGDDSLLQKGVELCPEFARDFFASLDIR